MTLLYMHIWKLGIKKYMRNRNLTRWDNCLIAVVCIIARVPVKEIDKKKKKTNQRHLFTIEIHIYFMFQYKSFLIINKHCTISSWIRSRMNLHCMLFKTEKTSFPSLCRSNDWCTVFENFFFFFRNLPSSELCGFQLYSQNQGE